MIDVEATFEKFDETNEYGKFDRIENKRSKRPDLHAFLLLDSLVPGEGDMVSAAEHDEIFLDTEVEKLAKVATEADILELVRCGVRYSEYDCLAMFA